MHKPEFVLKNETDKILWDFNILKDHIIPTRRPDLVITDKKKKKKENLLYCGFRRPSENEKRNKCVDLGKKNNKKLRKL